jgi:thiamine pyrophosphokinase
LTSLHIRCLFPDMFLIVSGGDAPGNGLLKDRAAHARRIIAADKGAQYCLDAGVIPDIVVGDMDSIASRSLERLQDEDVMLVKHPADKDQTDTQLALDLAVREDAHRVEMLAALGDRFDHSLANVHLLHYALSRGVPAEILSASQRIFLVDNEVVLRDSKGLTISLLPMTMKVEGIYLSGFLYELEDASMEIGNPYGISNLITSNESRIRIDGGILIVTISTVV